MTNHYVSVYIYELEIFDTKSAEHAKPAENRGSMYGRSPRPTVSTVRAICCLQA